MAGYAPDIGWKDALKAVGGLVTWVTDEVEDTWDGFAGWVVEQAPQLHNHIIDALRASLGLERIDHDLSEDSWAEKLINVFVETSTNNPAQIGFAQSNFENIMGIVTGGNYQTVEEKIAALAEENVTALEEAKRANTITEANRTVSKLLGSDRNWQRFFNFLTGRSVMMLGPSTEIDTLQEIWDAVAVDNEQGTGANSLNLKLPADRQRFREILANPGIYQRQFGMDPTGMDDVERDAVIDDFINTVQGRTDFVVIGGMASSLLDEVEGLDVGPGGQFILPVAEGAPQAAYDKAIEEGKDPAEAHRIREEAKKGTTIGTQDFFIPTFDGTAQGVIRGVGDLIAGLSINPAEVQKRLMDLPTDQLALVQSQLWQFGYFKRPGQGPEDFRWGMYGDSTYNALENMLVNLLEEQRHKGPDYPVERMLNKRRKENSVDMRRAYISAENDEKRAIRNSVIQQITSGLGGPLDEALSLALEESGVSLTTKGHAVYKEKLEEALKTVGMTGPELDAAYAESQRNDTAEMLLAAYYTDGSYVGDWSKNITVGGNTDSDWADFGIMTGVITRDEADILYLPTNQMHPSMHAQRNAIRQKLEENEVEIARPAMNWWLDQPPYMDTTTGKQIISQVDALEGYANTIGRYTRSMNGYDNKTLERISESIIGPVASQWLLDEVQGQDIPGDVADRIAQSAVDALGLPDAAPDISGAGSIRSVLRAIAGTGTPRGLRYG